MTIRLHVERTLVEHDEFTLPEGAARHAQVRRVQPGDVLRLFDGRGHERSAQVLEMLPEANRHRFIDRCRELASRYGPRFDPSAAALAKLNRTKP